ncbi:MAG: hypothetical protein LBK69_02355 [Syntrophomonadaceae bacterium]|nr:hypothetical protein [Syntrophomonadaceae bacterium]
MGPLNLLIKNHKHKIIPGKKSIEELLIYLKSKVDIIEISNCDIINTLLYREGITLVNSLYNHCLKLTLDELEYSIFHIINNEKSSYYYDNNYACISSVQTENIIFVAFEKQTRYIKSNSNKLMMELIIEQSITQYDYDNETSIFFDYLGRFDRYCKGEY